jgi:hypothetical protein
MKKILALFMLLAFFVPEAAWATYSCFGTTAPCGIALDKPQSKTKKTKKTKKSKKSKRTKHKKHSKKHKTKQHTKKQIKHKAHGKKHHGAHKRGHKKHGHKKARQSVAPRRVTTAREEPLTIVRDLPPVTTPVVTATAAAPDVALPTTTAP